MLEGDVQYDHLQIQEEIGVGAFGTIYSALYNDRLVAVKELSFSQNEHVQRLVVREVQSLKYGLILPHCLRIGDSSPSTTVQTAGASQHRALSGPLRACNGCVHCH